MNGDLSVLKYSEAGGAFEKYAQGLLNSNALTATCSDTINAVANGDAAMIFQGMFTISDILKENPDALNSLGVIAFPAMGDTVKSAMSQSLNSTYYITVETEHYDACVTLITYDPNLRKPLWKDLSEANGQLLWDLSQANVVKISDEEVEFLLNLGAEAGAAHIGENYDIKLVFVTYGAEGCFFKNKQAEGMVPSLADVFHS